MVATKIINIMTVICHSVDDMNYHQDYPEKKLTRNSLIHIKINIDFLNMTKDVWKNGN